MGADTEYTFWRCNKCGAGGGQPGLGPTFCRNDECGALLPGKEDPRDVRIRELEARIRELEDEVAAAWEIVKVLQS